MALYCTQLKYGLTYMQIPLLLDIVLLLHLLFVRSCCSSCSLMMHRCVSTCTWCYALALWETSSASEHASSQPWSTALPLTGSTPGQLKLWSVWPPAFWSTSLPSSQTHGRTLRTTWRLLTSLWQKHHACTWRVCGDTTTPHQR